MVTAVTAFTNAAGSATGTATTSQEPVLSDMAQATLERLGQMHTEFSQSAGALESHASPAVQPSAGNEADNLTRAMESFGDSFRTAAQIQSQIVQFSMATSISQSLGNNLNSFLKGT